MHDDDIRRHGTLSVLLNYQDGSCVDYGEMDVPMGQNSSYVLVVDGSVHRCFLNMIK